MSVLVAAVPAERSRGSDFNTEMLIGGLWDGQYLTHVNLGLSSLTTSTTCHENRSEMVRKT